MNPRVFSTEKRINKQKTNLHDLKSFTDEFDGYRERQADQWTSRQTQSHMKLKSSLTDEANGRQVPTNGPTDRQTNTISYELKCFFLSRMSPIATITDKWTIGWTDGQTQSLMN